MEKTDRMKWFTEARFGMFIHWGVYALPARGEWIRSDERMTIEDYEPYVQAFDPREFDADRIALAAKNAGMRYAVMTAKHHDGFCMFDSRLTGYTSMRTCGRDFVREYIEAFRRQGIRAGLYYSLLDWHHPDYPHYGDKHHPMRDNGAYRDYTYDFGKYLAYMHGQIRELCTNYGKIDILWTDFSYDPLRADAWHGEELVRMIRSLQPDIILNNRLEASGEGFGSLVEEHPKITSGDFVSPEQIIPPDGIRNVHGEPVPWEACITMNNHWGYCADDHYFKSSIMCIRKLAECVSKGGNLLLNIGPDAEGRIPSGSAGVLSEIGEWMAKNGESIYGCGYSGIDKPEYGRITAKDNVLYYHVTEPMIGAIPLPGIRKEQIASITLLHDGSNLSAAENWITNNYPDLVFVSLGDDPALPDPVDTVIRVILK